MGNRDGEFSKAVTDAAFDISGGVCQHCGDAVTKSTCRYHHRVPLYCVPEGVDPTIKSSLDNCVVLCKDCHDSGLGYILFHGLSASPKLSFRRGRFGSKTKRDIHFNRLEAFSRLISIIDNVYDLRKLHRRDRS